MKGSRIAHQIQMINTVTGEVIKSRILDDFGRRKQNEEGELQMLHHNTRRVSSILSDRQSVPPGVNDADLGRIYRLSKHLSDRNRIEDRNKRPLNATQIGKLIGINHANTHKFLRRCENADIIRNDGTGYYINPRYFAMCKYLPFNVYDMFADSLQDILPADMIEEYRSRSRLNENQAETISDDKANESE